MYCSAYFGLFRPVAREHFSLCRLFFLACSVLSPVAACLYLLFCVLLRWVLFVLPKHAIVRVGGSGRTSEIAHHSILRDLLIPIIFMSGAFKSETNSF